MHRTKAMTPKRNRTDLMICARMTACPFSISRSRFILHCMRWTKSFHMISDTRKCLLLQYMRKTEVPCAAFPVPAAARYPAAWDTPVLADGLKRIICVLKPYFLTACTEKNRFFAVRPVERGHFIRKKNRLFAVRPVERGHFIRKKKAAFRCETRRERSFHTEKKQAFRCETRRERSFHTDKNRAFRPEAVSAIFFVWLVCMARKEEKEDCSISTGNLSEG